MRTIPCLIFTLSLLMACSVKKKNKVVAQSPDVDSLINSFQYIEQGGMGFHPAQMSNDGFLPIDTVEKPQQVWGEDRKFYADEKNQNSMIQLVALGPKALPYLIKRLNDTTRIKFTIAPNFGHGIFYLNYYDHNKNQKEKKPHLKNVCLDYWNCLMVDVMNSSERSYSDSTPTKYTRRDTATRRRYTLTIGDLCFVTIGQIVNRGFHATGYQPSGMTLVISPVVKPELIKAITWEWQNLTVKSHKRSLLYDFIHPDRLSRRTGAYKRLLYYYPEMLDSLQNTNWKDTIIQLKKWL